LLKVGSGTAARLRLWNCAACTCRRYLVSSLCCDDPVMQRSTTNMDATCRRKTSASDNGVPGLVLLIALRWRFRGAGAGAAAPASHSSWALSRVRTKSSSLVVVFMFCFFLFSITASHVRSLSSFSSKNCIVCYNAQTRQRTNTDTAPDCCSSFQQCLGRYFTTSEENGLAVVRT
jgi:hypothetical protein